MAELRWHVRPDGRRVVWPDGEWTVDQARAAVDRAVSDGIETLTTLPDSAKAEIIALESAGLSMARREDVVELDVASAVARLAQARLPPGVVSRCADELGVDALRRLDDELRDDVPGTAGWHSSAADFVSDTLGDASFEPRTYPVAVDVQSGTLLGLVRIWMNKVPRIGMIGVKRAHRRRGIASALLLDALTAAHALGASRAVSEYDVTNVASRATFAKLGAVRIGSVVEYNVSMLLRDPRGS